MPNWCNNTLQMNFPKPLSESQASLLKDPVKLEKALAESCGLKETFNELKRIDGTPFEREQMISETGSKWYPFEEDTFMNVEAGHSSLSVFFDSAWLPPVELCLKLMNVTGATGELSFMESGVGIYGKTVFKMNDEDGKIESDTMSFEDDIEREYLQGVECNIYICSTKEALDCIREQQYYDDLSFMINDPGINDIRKENEEALADLKM